MIDNDSFITDFIKNIDRIREDEFTLNNFNYEGKIIEKKNLNENLKEFRQFQNNIKKKAMLEKYKPSNISKKEYDTSIETILDNLDNNIFKDDAENNGKNNGENIEEIKIDISLLDRNSKINLIKEFIYRKNIFLDETEINKIESIIDNPEIQIKKYINISKMYQQITKIGFIKKLENGTYVVDLSESKSKKTKNYFINKK
jgi:hypothetical protein